MIDDAELRILEIHVHSFLHFSTNPTFTFSLKQLNVTLLNKGCMVFHKYILFLYQLFFFIICACIIL